MIGIGRTAIQKGNDEVVYDNDDVRIDGDTLYTEKQSFNIVQKYELPFKSYRYVVQEVQIMGGNTYVPQVFDLSTLKGGKLQGINSFLTGNDVYDKQILKFVKREYRKKYGLEGIDKMKLKYDFSDAQQQINDITDEIKQYTKMYTKQKQPKFTKEKSKTTKRIFGVDYDTFIKYKNQVIGAQQYVNEDISEDITDDKQRLQYQIFGGCECEEDQGLLFQPNQYETLKYTGGGQTYEDNGDSIINQLQTQYKKEYKYSPSGYLISAINVGYDKLRFLQNNLKGGVRKEQEQPVAEQPIPQPIQEQPVAPQQELVQEQQPVPQQPVAPQQEPVQEQPVAEQPIPQQPAPQPPAPQPPALQPLIQQAQLRYDVDENNSIYSSEQSEESESSVSDEYNYNIKF